MVITMESEWCKGCGLCIRSCPKGAIQKSGKFNGSGYETVSVHPELCVYCGSCYTVCPDAVFEIRLGGAEA